MKVVEQDFFKVTWESFENNAAKIAEEIQEFCRSEEIEIDFICPIMRGGGILAIYLSHKLNIFPCLPVQYKYFHSEDDYTSPTLLWESFGTIPSKIKSGKKPLVILLVEGNHYTGLTAKKTIELINLHFNHPKILYVSLSRDYYHKDSVSGVVFNITGFYTNESGKVSKEQCLENRIIDKIPYFAWENIEEEMNEVNCVSIPKKKDIFS